MTDSLTYERAHGGHAEALIALFETSGSGCFDQFHHFTGDKNAWLERCFHHPEENRAALRERLAGSDLAGVVAVAHDGAIHGWMKLTPADAVPRLYGQRLYRGLPCFEGDRRGVYTISCFFVREEWRGRGVARGLLAAGIDCARVAGATTLEAFPRAGDSRESLRGEEVWTGPLPLFEEAGFQVVNDFRPYPVLKRRL